MTEPRRVLIDWDYGAHGIWWVLTKEEKEAPPARGRRVGIQPPGRLDRARPWSERLTAGLLDDLQAWNSAWDADNAEPRILQERGRELALRVQDELGTNGWEVLYRIGGRIFRVHPPGNWPVATWKQELLGYRPRRQAPGSPPLGKQQPEQQRRRTGPDSNTPPNINNPSRAERLD